MSRHEYKIGDHVYCDGHPWFVQDVLPNGQFILRCPVFGTKMQFSENDIISPINILFGHKPPGDESQNGIVVFTMSEGEVRVKTMSKKGWILVSCNSDDGDDYPIVDICPKPKTESYQTSILLYSDDSGLPAASITDSQNPQICVTFADVSVEEGKPTKVTQTTNIG